MLPIYRKAVYLPSFLDIHRIRVLGLTIHEGLISKSVQHNKVDKFGRRKLKLWLQTLK